MTVVDSLLLDAKQAILEEHYRRFQTFYKDGRLEEALRQFNVTMTCATNLLTESLQLLETTLEAHNHRPRSAEPPASE